MSLQPLAPISKAPPEILAAIFEQLAVELFNHSSRNPHFTSSSPHSPQQSTPASPIYSWIRLTQVCKSWRSIMRNAPSLWSYIQLTATAGVSLLLRRSCAAPLTVRCLALEDTPPPYHPGRFGSAFGKMMQNIHRIRSLELSINKSTRTTQFIALHLGQYPAPWLRSLYIYGGQMDGVSTPCRKWSMPQLERLEICAPLGGFWEPLMLDTLRHLVLNSNPVPDRSAGHRRAITESLPLLSVLTKLPSLQTLSMRLDKYTGLLDSSAIERIPLPHLRQLYLSGHTAHCINILSSLDIPITATITIDGTKNYRRRDSRQLGQYSTNIAFIVGRVLEGSTNPAPSPSIQTVRAPLSVSLAVRSGSTSFTLRAWSSYQSLHVFHNTDFRPDIDIHIPCRESETHLESLLSMLSLRHLRCLEIGPMDLLGPFGAPSAIVAWFQIFAQLLEVHTLRIRELDDPLFWLALLLPHEFAGAGVRFPKLKNLELVDVKFRRPTEINIVPRPSDGDEDHAHLTFTELTGHPDDFLQCLVLRNTAGYGVQKLHIERAKNFFEDDALFLRMVGAAEEIVWDEDQEYVDEIDVDQIPGSL